ncbi:aminotransferase class V-fold PLP-dependent enzyme [Kordiimonas lacus]|uniref:Selenocysteine lyase/Cysteine desulfurase n=1 Tax=Kordiimonas lacus TaxID=637679 RepID=A0A1G7CEQ7_9PROT|nr:aminotransferase class V-fold PLP-dependent enzyme [Kordiimonas lacus]SDE37743.1 Selenocysteine lyase/Cysteine desulfurase [Kordiimonas lacus]
MILPAQRDLFDIPRDVCYVNASYMTPLSRAQVTAGEQALQLSSQPWRIGADDFFNTAADVCAAGAALMRAKADDVAIVPSASYGISTAAKNLPVSAGGKVLVMAEEFPSNVYPWQESAKAAGGEVLAVPQPSDDDWTSAILEVMEREGEAIDIVSVANVHWSSGAVVDLVAVSVACKRVGAALVLDLSQSLGAMPIDIPAIDPDFMVAAGYKWLLGPYSISLMYVAPRHHGGVPIEAGWITREGSRNFANLVNYRDGFEPGARRFDMGERANHVLAPIFLEGLNQLLGWGVENIYESLGAITGRMAAVLAARGMEPIASERRAAHILGVRVGDKGPALEATLKDAGVSVSLRGDLLRLSPHLWVDGEDEDRFNKVVAAL